MLAAHGLFLHIWGMRSNYKFKKHSEKLLVSIIVDAAYELLS
jgi:hypothetical protein